MIHVSCRWLTSSGVNFPVAGGRFAACYPYPRMERAENILVVGPVCSGTRDA